jgi:hypothetical protein
MWRTQGRAKAYLDVKGPASLGIVVNRGQDVLDVEKRGDRGLTGKYLSVHWPTTVMEKVVFVMKGDETYVDRTK